MGGDTGAEQQHRLVGTKDQRLSEERRRPRRLAFFDQFPAGLVQRGHRALRVQRREAQEDEAHRAPRRTYAHAAEGASSAPIRSRGIAPQKHRTYRWRLRICPSMTIAEISDSITAEVRNHMRQHTPAALLAGLVVVFSLSHPVAGQLGQRPVDDWSKVLEGADRVGGLKVDEVVANLHLKPRDIVADIGAGPGLFEVPMAKAVAPGGRI